MDYDASMTVTWGELMKFMEKWPGQLVYINFPRFFWPLVIVGVCALVVIAIALIVMAVRSKN